MILIRARGAHIQGESKDENRTLDISKRQQKNRPNTGIDYQRGIMF